MAKYPNTKVNYESEITDFLREFDKRPEAHSEARRFEEEKYQEIHKLRDDPEQTKKAGGIWKDF